MINAAVLAFFVTIAYIKIKDSVGRCVGKTGRAQYIAPVAT